MEDVKQTADFDIKIDRDFHSRKPMEKKPIEKNYEFDGIIISSGVLEIMPDGYGFLRSADYNYLNSPMILCFAKPDQTLWFENRRYDKRRYSPSQRR
jgi:transcription termination factor Rho